MKQILGNFKKNVNLFLNPIFCHHLGIQGHTGDIVIINNEEIALNYRGILELDNIQINSLMFKNNVNHVIIDYT